MIFSTSNINSFDNKEQVAFDTYHSYLHSISQSIESNVESIDDFFSEFTSNRAFNKIQTKKNVDIEKISKILRNAWYTEFQLKNLSVTSDFAEFSLHWGQVYSYYACYLQIRAYLICQNQKVNPKHRTTLRHFAQELEKRRNLFPSPWNVMCCDDPTKNKFINKKEPYVDSHQLSNIAKQNPVDNFAKFLKTTRQKEIKRKCEEWKEDNNKRKTPSAIKKKIIEDTPPTSIYDCLYRLRIRANYENADTFIFSTIPDNKAMGFHKSLNNIVWISSLILETITAKYLSWKNYKPILEKYENMMSKKVNENELLDPKSRFELFEGIIK